MKSKFLPNRIQVLCHADKILNILQVILFRGGCILAKN